MCMSLQAGSRVQCAARAVNSNKDEGLELSSPIATFKRVPPQFKRVPPQFKRVPPQFKLVPPQFKLVPPQFKLVPPQFKRVPPQFKRVPPQFKLVPPQFKLVPPQFKLVPPQFKLVPPQFKRVAPSFNLVPPQFKLVPPQFNLVPPQFKLVPPLFKRVPPQFKLVPPQFKRVPPQFKRVPPQFKRMCQPRKVGTVGAGPFSAKLRYTGAEDPDHPNLLKLTVAMPHIDGMLPVISTHPLSNMELTLSPDGTRVGNHRCSNLLDYSEVTTGHGFITATARNAESVGDTFPYQYSTPMRGDNTLRFYKNLNLEACLWGFTSYYNMSELLTDCGGTIRTDGQPLISGPLEPHRHDTETVTPGEGSKGNDIYRAGKQGSDGVQVLNLVQSYVTLRVPLHVSYVFHSPVGAGGWQHFDLQSELRLTFVYDTAILWKDGIGSPPQAELQGALYPTSMPINEQGRLVVNFKTKARFRGLFVEANFEGRIKSTASSLSSMVMCEDNPGLTFNLSLVRSEPTYNQPVQQWTFTSDFAVHDYSGTYRVNLIPCTTAQNMEYTVPPVCNPREPVTFHLDIRFQQVSEPVSLEFSLNTQIFLLSKRNLWLSDGSMGFGQESDVAFSEGDTIYGLVMVDPVQNLGDSFFCNIEKVYLCTGADGYVPKYNPTNFEFGCLAESPSLLYHFKILDKAQPETQARGFGDVEFNAMLAADDPSTLSLVRQPGTDGFRLDSTAMFQVAAGREWFIHTIYTIRSKDNANHGIGKRSLEYHHSLVATGNDLSITPGVKGQGHRVRRSASGLVGAAVPDVADDIGADNNRGTNIMHIALDQS
ncbi:FRAS1-related extracellular matrix protein 2-like [Salvelinus alpinus]